ncbi:DinB family protein [Dokdonella sp.]|uniref:DinB family protein n=1 Tax=Dokdonella sp. TaxID=2291710 RepID=UPI00352843C2
MSLKDNFELLARYNRWMNQKVYAAAERLPRADLHADRGAFFGSVFGTLNHILVADTLWLKRFAKHPAGFPSLRYMASLPTPVSLAQQLYSELGELRRARVTMDDVIIDMTGEAHDTDYEVKLTYANTSGQTFTRQLSPLMQHVFNHQTHHRGQITTLLNQAGIDVGVTDLAMMVMEEDRDQVN